MLRFKNSSTFSSQTKYSSNAFSFIQKSFSSTSFARHSLFKTNRRFESSKTFSDRSSSQQSLHNVDLWVLNNMSPYNGSNYFLEGPSDRTLSIWSKVKKLIETESLSSCGVLSIDPSRPGSIVSHSPGYIEREQELIYGMQTDEPLKRAVKPRGGLRHTIEACKYCGYDLDAAIIETFSRQQKSHAEAVQSIYTPEMIRAKANGLLSGLPETYGRGRIIGDYRRVALFGVDEIIRHKKRDKLRLGGSMTPMNIIMHEELAAQIHSLDQLKTLSKSYGIDLSRGAKNAREAIQWLYFGYLAAVKESDGVIMSLGKIDDFLDVFIERDLQKGIISEQEAQELIDDLVIKLRMIRHLRSTEFSEHFAGGMSSVSMKLGGMMHHHGEEHRVTRTAFRMLNTLKNLGHSPEPSFTVLWNPQLPDEWKGFCSEMSIQFSSIQFENDFFPPHHWKQYRKDELDKQDLRMTSLSSSRIGKMMLFYGGRCNLPKLLLYSINGGRDELTKQQVAPNIGRLEVTSNPLSFDDVMPRFVKYLDWLAWIYVNTANVIHFCHDKYNYEAIQMALHDTNPTRLMAFGVAGLSVVADSLSAIKHAKVYPIRDESGEYIRKYKVVGEYPQFGNDDDRVDLIAREVLSIFLDKLKEYQTHRDAEHVLSVFTTTSNVVYGNMTGATPDGRKERRPFAAGANPMHGRDNKGVMASLRSVTKLPFDICRDGVSTTLSVVPSALGSQAEIRREKLTQLLDDYFGLRAHHLNVNVLQPQVLKEAMHKPEEYPDLIVRLCGHPTAFTKLSREQQEEIISRTFHSEM
eukprot:gb/GECH01011747.1/.p1 GENE.gb/GECH01011747.1/~~gb/GECH01011747.1/.p1  ORF type:complete len:802 (+),score=207.86 gb/GECH01011747.1/:1-2406(+)